MISHFDKNDSRLSEKVFEAISTTGVCVIENVLSSEFLKTTRSEMYKVSENILMTVGQEKLLRANERGVLRLMMKWSDHFYQYLQIPEILSVIDRLLGNTCVMHLQNGFILPPTQDQQNVFQYQFHRDFPRILNGYLCSLNVFFAIDEFREDNGSTQFVLGSHQKETTLSQAEIDKVAVTGKCPAGSAIIFDSTLIHAAGQNRSGADRLAINHQFTKSYFKQQLDYVRALGEKKIVSLDERTKQLLGWYTRVPTSLDEYYVPSNERLYRAGQG